MSARDLGSLWSGMLSHAGGRAQAGGALVQSLGNDLHVETGWLDARSLRYPTRPSKPRCQGHLQSAVHPRMLSGQAHLWKASMNRSRTDLRGLKASRNLEKHVGPAWLAAQTLGPGWLSRLPLGVWSLHAQVPLTWTTQVSLTGLARGTDVIRMFAGSPKQGALLTDNMLSVGKHGTHRLLVTALFYKRAAPVSGTTMFGFPDFLFLEVFLIASQVISSPLSWHLACRSLGRVGGFVAQYPVEHCQRSARRKEVLQGLMESVCVDHFTLTQQDPKTVAATFEDPPRLRAQ